MNFMGGAGMFAVSLYMIFMGKHYDTLLAAKLPAGSSLAEYSASPAGSEMANLLAEAKKTAGPDIINTTLVIPVILIVAFAILFVYMRGKKKAGLQTLSAA